MAWLTKGNQRYYYRSRRSGGKVISEYVGSGVYAEFAEQQAGIEQAQRVAQRAQWAQWRSIVSEQAELDRQIDDIGAQVQALVEATLLVNGYHTHKRGWRKQRGDR